MSKDMAEARAGKARVVANREKDITGQVEAILADERVDDELKRKLRYCQDELQRRKQDGILLHRRVALIAEVTRRLQIFA